MGNRVQPTSQQKLFNQLETQRSKNTSVSKQRNIPPLSSSTIHRTLKEVPPFEPSTPKLDLPNPIQKCIQTVQKYEEVIGELFQTREKIHESLITRIQQIDMEKEKKFQEALAQAKDATFWGILQDVSSICTGAVSTVFGFSLLFSGVGSIAGGALIASGVLSISNLFFKYTDTWKWLADQVAYDHPNAHYAITTYIPTALGILATSTGIYGGIHMWATGAITESNKIPALIQTTLNIASNCAALNEGWSNSNLKKTYANTSFLQTNAKLLKIDLESLTRDMKNIYENELEIVEMMKQLIREATQIVQIIHQAV